jgi:Kef-type K+ transport system membrane component KefB/CBS domain-containing protein
MTIQYGRFTMLTPMTAEATAYNYFSHLAHELCDSVFPPSDPMTLMGHHTNFFVIVGLTILLGTLGARLFQALRIPQVVGFIASGIIAGATGFNIFSSGFLQTMQYLNFFALAIIGFNIGGELKIDTFKSYGKQFLILLLSEGLTAFFLVTLFSGITIYLFTGNIYYTVALALLLGAISSATAPAATVDVIWEYKSKGLLTTTLLALVALDDGLSLILFSFASAIAKILYEHSGTLSFFEIIRHPMYEIFGAVLVGGIGGLMLNRMIRSIKDSEKTLDFSIGSILFFAGLAILLKINLILTTMILGFALGNLAPRRSKHAFETIQRFSPPVYALFFVFVGARLKISGLPTMAWALVAVFLVFRSLGKISGIYFGGKLAKSPEKIQKWLGISLFSQAGVAIGLSILASQTFDPKIGDMVLLVVTTTTFVVQLIGPPCVKISLERSGEAGCDVNYEDLVERHDVKEFTVNAATCPSSAPAGRVVDVYMEHPVSTLCIVDEQNKIAGIISAKATINAFPMVEDINLLIAEDMMTEAPFVITDKTSLKEALATSKEMFLESVPVISSETSEYIGVLDILKLQRTLKREHYKLETSA